MTSLSINSSSVLKISNSLERLDKLKYLSLRCENLNVFPKTVSSIQTLEEIDIYIKSPISLPDDFGALDNLRKFRWGQCHIFPESVFDCKNLAVLTFDKSFFDTIPIGISKLDNLKRLKLTFGIFENLPADFSDLSSLEEVELTGSKLYGLPKDISNIQSVNGIDLQYCENIKNADDLLESLRPIENLKWLIISYSGLNEEDQNRIKKELGL